jgi:hypothetical protein
VWNWALAEWKRQYEVYAAIKEGRACPSPRTDETPQAPSALALKKPFNEIRREQYSSWNKRQGRMLCAILVHGKNGNKGLSKQHATKKWESLAPWQTASKRPVPRRTTL